jgi:3-hydroxyacyl-[acyl-carrier-protein] dehydratase
MQIGIGIKYCGGCNPHIDRTKLVQQISKLLPEYIFTTQRSSPWEIGIMVCGCPTACVDKPEFKNLAREWIVVAGNCVETERATEEKLAEIVVDRITGIKDSSQ